MKVKIIKENSKNPHSWYNKIKPNSTLNPPINGFPSKVGKIYEVIEEDEKTYRTIEKVFSGKIQGLICKEDCEIIEG